MDDSGKSSIPGLNGGLKGALKSKSPSVSVRSSLSDEGGRRKSLSAEMHNGDLESKRLASTLSSDPLKLELTRLENELKVKGRELEKMTAETKGLKQIAIGKEKAIEKLRGEVEKLREKLILTEKQLGDKILELKKTNELKKAALQAQAAAEATTRRLQSSWKDVEAPSEEMIRAPIEAQLKLAQKEISRLQEDNKAQERLRRTKEAALLEAEKTIAAALLKAAQTEDLINKNRELLKEMEQSQEENKTLDRMFKQKVEEVKDLTERVRRLEEEVTAGGASASTIKDYKRQVQDLQATQRTLHEELGRTKVAANRVAVVVANDWKDGTDKVMPVKVWLEERRVIQAEMQALRDKLVLAERAAKFEAHMKEQYQQRMKVIEEGLKSGYAQRDVTRRLSVNSPQEARTPVASEGSDMGERSGMSRMDDFNNMDQDHPLEAQDEDEAYSRHEEGSFRASFDSGAGEDTVPGAIHDLLQKEVVGLRKTALSREQALKEKEAAMETLNKKLETVIKAHDVDSKKSRREILALEKELSNLKAELTFAHDAKSNRFYKEAAKSSSPIPSIRKSLGRSS